MSIDQSRLTRKERVLFFGWRWVAQIWDPLFTFRGLRELPHFFATRREYAQRPGAERLRILDAYPQLHDRTSGHGLDAHYFYVNAWAMRRVAALAPSRHMDFASQPILSGLLSSLMPVEFLDYRPLQVDLNNLTCRGGDLLDLPYTSESLESVSCLHVAEHVGLGRYGDELDPHGTQKACREMVRVLRPGGNLLFAVPIGKPRLCFNAHRIHAPSTILEYFADLNLKEFSVVHDDGRFIENAELDSCDTSVYALGMFWFQRHE